MTAAGTPTAAPAGRGAARRAAAESIVTPTLGRSLRRSVFWIVAALALIALGLGMLTLTGATAEADRFGADESAPAGSRALVEVLRDQGVDVVVRDSLDGALDAVDDPEATTILAADPIGLVDPAAWARLDGAAARLVLVEPGPAALEALAPDVFPVDLVDGAREAGCAEEVAERSGTVEGTGPGYDSVAGSAEVCFDGDGGALLVTVPALGGDAPDGAVVSALGGATLLQNDTVARQGNAALALGLLGEHPRLVWWVGTAADADPGVSTLAELTPGWVNPLAWLALTVGLAAAIWRGRRLGPVVIENLPVVVRTTETMEGRARLYARAGARLRALDALRLGALRRLGESLGLGPAAGIDEIIASTAAATGRPRDALRTLLVDREPETDRELVDLSDALAALEAEVHRRVGLDAAAPESAAPPAGGATDPDPTRRMDR